MIFGYMITEFCRNLTFFLIEKSYNFISNRNESNFNVYKKVQYDFKSMKFIAFKT